MKKLFLTTLALIALNLLAFSQARVQVIHNSPTPGTAAGPVVDIYVNGGLLPELTAVPFRAATPYLDVPAGVDIEVAVAVNPSNGVEDAIATFPLGQLVDGQAYTVIAAGVVNDPTTPFNLYAAASNEVAAAPTNVDVLVFHGSPDAPSVDVDARRVVNDLVSDLAFGSYNDYLNLPPGDFILDVRVANDPNIVASFAAPLSGLAGSSLTLFASGLLNDTPGFGLYAALADGTVLPLDPVSLARLQVIHNSPTPGTDAGPVVDIYVNGGLLPELTAVPFRAATPYLDVPAGEDIEVAVAVSPSTGVGDAIATFPLGQLDNGGTYSVIAAGIVGDNETPFNLFAGPGRETSDANVNVQVFHGSPGAPNVDVDARFIGELVGDLAYGSYTDEYLSLEPDGYLLDVLVAGTDDIAASFIADLNGLGGNPVTVFASGLLGDTPGFGLYAALTDGTVVPFAQTELATLQVIHNSPSPTVDIYVNGNEYLQDFEYLTATAFDLVPAGTPLNIQIAPETSQSADDAIYSVEVTLENGENYIAIAHGIAGDAENPLAIALTAGARESANDPGQVELIGFHGIPTAPTVDLVDYVSGDTVVEGLEYGQFTDGYVGTTAAAQALEMRVNGDGTLVGNFFAGLTGLEGLSGVLMAGGLLDGDPLFNLFLVTPGGIVLPLTPVTDAQLIHNSPAAIAQVVDLYSAIDPASQNDFALEEDDFAFRTATAYGLYPTRLPITIGVAPGNSTGPADILFQLPPVTFEDGKAYSIIANGIPGDADFPFGLVASDQAQIFSSGGDQVGLLAFHGSPGAPNVDIDARTAGVNLYNDLAYGSFADYLEVGSAAEFLELYAAGDDNLVATFDASVLELAGGLGLTTFASGILGGEPDFGLFAATPAGQVLELGKVSRTQIIHNSPSPTVDIYINGEVAVPGLAFRDATPMVDLPTNTELDIAVVPAGGMLSEAVATVEDLTLNDGDVNIIMANGVVGDATTPFEIVLNRNGQDRAKDPAQVDLSLFHGSPDAPEVDVQVSGGPVLFDNVAYGDFSMDYLGVDPALYRLEVTPSNDNTTIVKTYDADVSTLTSGAAVVFASGFLAQDGAVPFEVWVALPGGNTFPLSEIVSTDELNDVLSVYSTFPNPTARYTTVDLVLEEEGMVNLSLVDLSGRVLKNFNLGRLPSGAFREQIDLGDQPAGLYHLRLQMAQGQATQPILIVD